MERVLISLPIRYGELTIPIFHEAVENEFLSSSKTTSELVVLIKQQILQYNIIEDNLKKHKTEIKK